jgi:hypothetical protein
MPNESTTWLMTSERLGFEADAEDDEGGRHGYEVRQEQR